METSRRHIFTTYSQSARAPRCEPSFPPPPARVQPPIVSPPFDHLHVGRSKRGGQLAVHLLRNVGPSRSSRRRDASTTRAPSRSCAPCSVEARTRRCREKQEDGKINARATQRHVSARAVAGIRTKAQLSAGPYICPVPVPTRVPRTVRFPFDARRFVSQFRLGALPSCTLPALSALCPSVA